MVSAHTSLTPVASRSVQPFCPTPKILCFTILCNGPYAQSAPSQAGPGHPSNCNTCIRGPHQRPVHLRLGRCLHSYCSVLTSRDTRATERATFVAIDRACMLAMRPNSENTATNFGERRRRNGAVERAICENIRRDFLHIHRNRQTTAQLYSILYSPRRILFIILLT